MDLLRILHAPILQRSHSTCTLVSPKLLLSKNAGATAPNPATTARRSHITTPLFALAALVPVLLPPLLRPPLPLPACAATSRTISAAATMATPAILVALTTKASSRYATASQISTGSAALPPSQAVARPFGLLIRTPRLPSPLLLHQKNLFMLGMPRLATRLRSYEGWLGPPAKLRPATLAFHV